MLSLLNSSSALHVATAIVGAFNFCLMMFNWIQFPRGTERALQAVMANEAVVRRSGVDAD